MGETDKVLVWLRGEIMTMKQAKRKKLEEKGWKVGTATEFLYMTPAEESYIELRLSLSRSVKELRTKKRLSQAAFAKQLNSSQSRVAKMEAGDASVSIDLLVKSLFSLGVSQQDLAKAITSKR